MSSYRNDCDACGDSYITEAWEPLQCPFCELNALRDDLDRITAELANERAAHNGALSELSEALGSKHLTMASAIAYVRGAVQERDILDHESKVLRESSARAWEAADAAIRERDARPEITPEDAAVWVSEWRTWEFSDDEMKATRRIRDSLRAHAARAARKEVG